MDLGKPIASGNTAEIYLWNSMVVKLFRVNASPNEAVHEASKQTFAYENSLLVPKVFDVTKIGSRQAIMMEYIKGKTLGEILIAKELPFGEVISLSVEVQQSLHNVTIHSSNLERMKEKLKRQIHAADQLEQWKKTELLQLLEEVAGGDKLCHGDFHLFNLIVANNRVFMIDWVDASVGDIHADVYRSYLLYSQYAEELAEKFLFYYCKASGLSRQDIFKWAPIIAAARLSEEVALEDKERLLSIIYERKRFKNLAK